MRKKTNNEFINDVKNCENGDEYTFLEEYKGTNTKIKVRHDKCGHEYEVTPNSFINKGNRCPKCRILERSNVPIRNNEEFLKEVKKVKNGDEYTFLEEFKGQDTKIKVRHDKCGHEYEVTPSNFFKGRRCPKHANNKKRTNDQFLEDVKNCIHGEEYIFLEEYINTDTPIKVRHNVCQSEYKVSPKEFIHNNARCKYCNHGLSFFAEIIHNFLIDNNIKFELEYSISSFSNGKKFDFWLPEMKLLIEYDGEQHFKHKIGTINDFEDQVKRDKLKNEFIKNNKEYKLLRIGYKSNKFITKILEDFLINRSSTTIESYHLLLIEDGIMQNYDDYYKYNKR